MNMQATYHDGLTALSRTVECRFEGAAPSGRIGLRDPERDREIASWRMLDLVSIAGRRDELRLANTNGPEGARLVFSGRERSDEARRRLPVLAHHRRRERGRQMRMLALSTTALASVIVAYLFGVPLLADRIVTLIPPETEMRFGDVVVEQAARSLAEQGGLEVCDTNPDSTANQAIRRFAEASVDGVDTPFEVDIQVVRNSIPNAFAMPGGRAFYFSGLLEKTETQDEFAGVMAHEIGHVVHRHGMQSLVATAGTGLLVGFVLGDVTGISIAAGLGASLIDTSFSRESERQADAFSARVSQYIGFEPTAFADMLDRVSEDDSFSRALALLSTHPLTAERRLRLEAMQVNNADLPPAFSAIEWRAIKTMCDEAKSSKSKSKSK